MNDLSEKPAGVDGSAASPCYQDDSGLLATEDWLNSEFGCEESSDFAIEHGDDHMEVWHNWRVRVEIPSELTMTRANARRVVAFLRSFPS